MSLPRILLLGAGGHARVLAEALRAAGFPEPLGCLDRDPEARPPAGLPLLGDETTLPRLRAAGAEAAVVALGDGRDRIAAGDRLRALGLALPVLVHPTATLSPSASLGEGAVVLTRAHLGPGACLGRLALVNTGAIVEHDAEVGEGAHAASGSILSGGAALGRLALLGAGAATRPGVRIGAGAVVGAGSAVISDVPEGARVGGVPARRLRG